jgi:hypothetical protein
MKIVPKAGAVNTPRKNQPMRTIERRTEMMRISEQFLELVSVFKEA